MVTLWAMALIPEHSPAANSGYQEISALAGVWAATAVQAALEPDDDEVLSIMAKMLGRLATAPTQTGGNEKGRLTSPKTGWVWRPRALDTGAAIITPRLR
jgi:hypothetical protein